MNQQSYRLVFSRRFGMLVAVAENARACGKSASGEGRSAGVNASSAAGAIGALVAAALLAAASPHALAQTRPAVVFASKLGSPASNLPVPYGSAGGANSGASATPRAFAYNPALGSGSADLAKTGAVSWTTSGNTATFNQGNVDRVVLNWDSFNIGAGYKVHFAQNTDPSRYVSALNRIWSADPSVILGSLTADREVILLNANGVYFGRGAVVDTGKFVATALNIADSVFDKGLRNITDGSAVFGSAGSDGYASTSLVDSDKLRSAAISVEAGAEIRTAAGGDVLLIAPRVLNQGRINTPSGQTVLAAGDKVYLMSSADPAQRGLIVAVDAVKASGSNAADSTLGTVENTANGSTDGLVNRVNEIRAESGTVNLVGLTVRQNGQINATTAVKGANGAIYLQAMASTAALPAGAATTFGSAGARGLTIESGATVRVGAELGTVEIGAGSHTAVLPSSSTQTQLDAEVFNASRIRVEGNAISVGAGASISAPAGKIELLAASNSLSSPLFDSTLPLASVSSDGSRIIIAPGASISAAGLSDVEVDGARNQGVQRLFRIDLADAPVQRSGPLYRAEVYFDLRDGTKISAANVSGAAAAVGRTAAERATAGGSLRIESEGAVVLGQDSVLDVSGGSTHYSATVLQSSLVLRDGHVMGFASLPAGTAIDELLTLTQSVSSPAYTEGQAGGQLSVVARQAALLGTLKGSVVEGERQRNGLSARATAAGFTLGRGESTLQYMPAVELDAASPPALATGFFDQPLNIALDTLPTITGLSLSMVQAAGFGKLALRAGSISQPEFATLDLGSGGVLDLQAGSTLALNGAFSAAGGSIALQTVGELHLSATSKLDVAGRWVNDTAGAAVVAAASGSSSDGSPQIKAGSISLSSTQAALVLDAGASLDASAGAWLANTGTLTLGSAGAVKLSGARINPDLGAGHSLDGVALSAYGFSRGGQLTLGVPELRIADLGAGAAGSGFTLSPAFFSSHGFDSITVNTGSNPLLGNGDISVLAGTQLAPQLLNWQLTAGFRSAPSGAMSAAVATAQTLDAQLVDRKPVNLTLNAARALDIYGGSNLVVERGASIALEPGGALSLSATRNLSVGASGGEAGQTAALTAPGGSLALTINGTRGAGSDSSKDLTGFLGDQAIWLGNDALLSVAGVAMLRPSAGVVASTTALAGDITPLAERNAGAVLGGGSISLNAKRGYVIAEAGSSLLLDGASAMVSLSGMADAVRVSKAAGSLSVSTPEGFVLDGRISAQAPLDAAGHALADGGKLSLSVALGGQDSDTSGARKYLDDASSGATPKARSVHIGDYDGLLARQRATLGEDLPALLDNGIGYLRTSTLADAGFASLALGAGDSIRFDSSLALAMPLGLQLNAPAISAAPGVQLSLSSAVAQLGDASFGRVGNAPDRSALAASADHGSTLRVSAPTIELVGSWGLQGFSQVVLDAGGSANGEIRLSPVGGGTSSATLGFAGRLDMVAAQVYATSGGLYTLTGLPAGAAADVGSTLSLRTGASGAATAMPLSAFGALVVNATQIEQNGVLRQPFGQIVLNAERTLTLGDGSITSVSGQGVTVPYGETANLVAWNLPGGDVSSTLPRDKRITLSGANVITSASAQVDASGGGTVQASEFFAGVGGSTDYFDTAGLYAVLPDHAATQALALTGGLLAASQQRREIVITSAGSGLAPGRYTLLPARYALIGGKLAQGAYLVSRAADQGKAVLSTSVLRDDGSTVVSGYMTEAGSVNVGTPGERFVVEPSATYLAKSEIRLTDVSTLLASRAATLGSVSTTALPRDAGALQLTVTGSHPAPLLAALNLAGNSGQAGQLDISAAQLALVDDLSKTPAGALGVNASVVAASGAGSVLLGGQRSLVVGSADSAAASWAIDQSATSSVTVDIGQQVLQVQELLLAAKDSVTLAAGTQINASASASQTTLGARTLTSTGDGALLALSANALEVQRSGASLAASTGSISVGANSVLSGTQVALDASSAMQLDNSTRLNAQALSLAARHIVVGAGASAEVLADTGSTLLGGALLATVQAASELSLRASDSIDFIGLQNWSARASADAAAQVVATRLVLDAPLIRGLNAADGSAAHTDIAAQSVLLRNSSGRSVAAGLSDSSGQGELVLQALPPLRYGSTGGLTLGGGAVTLGFEASTLRSGGDIVLDGSGSTSAQNALTLSAARLTATTGANQALSAAGTLQLARASDSRTLGERVGQGAALQLSAKQLLQDGVINLPGGKLTLLASGADNSGALDSEAAPALRFGAGSITSVAGFVLDAGNGFEAYGRAGSLSASATQGRIDLLGTLDVSAASRADGTQGLGDAGSITLSATGSGGGLRLQQTQADGSAVNGTLRGLAGSGSDDLGGRLLVDVSSMASADTLARRATAGGFSRELSLRVRSGDLTLDSDISARQITLSADAGTLSIGSATLNADADSGGVVQLSAGQDLRLGDASRISARSTRAGADGGANGGDVLLASSAGRISLATGTQIDASGDEAADGRIVLRAQRGADNKSVMIDALDSRQLVAGEVDIEAVRSYSTVTVAGVTRDITAISAASNAITGSGVNRSGTLGLLSLRTDSNNFMANQATMLSALGISTADAGRVHLRAGVEVLASGNLAISNDLALNNERPGGDAGFLTLRAAGNLNVLSGSISDGFSTATSAGVLNDNPRSWSYRLVAGADLSAANPLAVRDFSQAGSESAGNLTVGAGRMLRTGAGSIELAAGRDIVFAAGTGSTAQGLAYVAGRKSAEQADVLATLFAGQSAKPIITEQGGRLTLNARRNVSSAEATQLVNNWLWRSGIVSSSGDQYAASSQLAWWTQFSSFRQTLGSFGGGNLTVNAGGDISNLQAMVPTVAWADSQTIADATLQVRNGGDLSVSAGGSVLGGQYLLGQGNGRLRAEASIGALSSNVRVDSPLLALLDGRWDVAARGAVAIGSAFDPTAMPVSSSDSRANFSRYFYSWGSDASLNLNATSGAVSLSSELLPSSLQAYGLSIGTTVSASADKFAQVIPASLSITAASSDITLFADGRGGALLAPSANGQLSLWSGADLTLGSNSRLVMAGSDPALWPDFAQPSSDAELANGLLTNARAATLAGSSLHAADATPALLHAEGSIDGSGAAIVLPKAAQITAGLDILGLQLSGQNMNADDTTSITAGRNLLAGAFGNITLAGPGALIVSAGRQLDLENSAGVTTTGNQSNATLAAQGASLSLRAATAGTLDLAALQAKYLQPADAGGSVRSASYRALLLALVRTALKQPGLSYEQAWAYFQTFPAAAQAAFGQQVLAAEFAAVYLLSTPPTTAQMTETLRLSFEQHKAEVLAAGAAALAANQGLTLPGREVLQGAALVAYLAEIRALAFSSLDIDSSVAARVSSLAAVYSGWRDSVAKQLGGTVASFAALAAQDPQAPALLAYQAALQDSSGPLFTVYRAQVLAAEASSTGAAASLFGVKSLPMRLALYDQGFQAAELAGAGSFVATPIWSGSTALLSFSGSLDMTQSSVVTERGGDISLINAGGAINVGLKPSADASVQPKGVIARGGGDVFGMAKDDFQVNNQRVFVVGEGDLTIWSSNGDIDSGRGANTAVAAPPLAARRTVDGMVFETPAATTGSGLGILADASGRASGTIGLYAASGEILATDAFIRGPVILLGSTVRGADNLLAPTVGGATAVVSAPALAVTAPASTNQTRTADNPGNGGASELRPRNSLLTVDLLGLGPAADDDCADKDKVDNKCPPPAKKCSDADKAKGLCK